MEEVEHAQQQIPLAEQYAALLELEPKLITNYVPANALEQKNAFISGEIRNPNHIYPKLEAIDFPQRYVAIQSIGNEILSNPTLEPKFQPVYREFVDGYVKRTRLMELARIHKSADDADQKLQAEAEYMQLNVELNGAPDEVTYKSLMGEKLTQIEAMDLRGDALRIRQELFSLVEFNQDRQDIARFKPSRETIDWAHDTAEALYADMLVHIPEQDSFNVAEVQKIFEEIITEEFGEAASDWRVRVEPAKSINVKSAEKSIVIPEDKTDVTREVLRGLVVHELGVHMLRAVTGGETDLSPLQNGLSDYYDSEEGLGVVMGQALKGEFRESGTNQYITAGLAYFENKDFRDIFEVKWRLAALGKLSASDDIDSAAIAKAQGLAYNGVMRSLRGTDELPWFKDLAYYNGSVDTWRHLELIRGDDLKFSFMLLGKANAANIDHERILYETKTIN